jgi:lysozyme
MSSLQEKLIRDEGLRLKPYRCSAGKLTIGVGRNLDDVGISEEEAMHMLRNDIFKARKGAWLIVGDDTWGNLTKTRKKVLINMCFNLGAAGLRNFVKMLIAVRLGNYERAADEMLDSKWARQVGARAQRLSREMRKG